MPTLANLRSRKTANVNFKPSTAYWIAGHGEEINYNNTFKVPPGCVIVVKATPGEVIMEDAYNTFINTLCVMDKEKLKDPLTNSNYLIEKFGAVSIFKPGDDCPIFHYTLISCASSMGSPFSQCNPHGSGVIAIDEKIEEDICEFQKKVGPSGDAVNFISSLYENSALPTKTQVQDAIANLKIDTDKISWQMKDDLSKVDHIIRRISSLWKIDQSTICNTLGPGVYYNFICRFRGKESNDMYNMENPTRNRRGSHVTLKGIETIKPMVTSVEDNIDAIRNRALIRNRIGEAETKRKAILAKYYNPTGNVRVPNVLLANPNRRISPNKWSSSKARKEPISKNWRELLKYGKSRYTLTGPNKYAPLPTKAPTQVPEEAPATEEASATKPFDIMEMLEYVGAEDLSSWLRKNPDKAGEVEKAKERKALLDDEVRQLDDEPRVKVEREWQRQDLNDARRRSAPYIFIGFMKVVFPSAEAYEQFRAAWDAGVMPARPPAGGRRSRRNRRKNKRYTRRN